MSNDTKNRDAWLAERNAMIGASESPSILGYGYETAADVWARKIGHEVSEDDNIRLLIGNALQTGIIEIARHVMQKDIVAEEPWKIRKHSTIGYVGASLDAFIREDGVDVPVDVKNVDGFMAKEWESEPPLGYQIQLQQQMLITGADHGYLFALIGGNRPKYHPVKRNDVFIGAMLERLAAFWALVQSRTPPPYEDPYDQRRVLAALYPKGHGTAVSLGRAAVKTMEHRDRVDAELKRLNGEREACNNILKAMLADNTFGRLPDGRWISWKEQTVAPFVNPGYTSRVMRVLAKEPKGAPAIGSCYEDRLRDVTDALVERGAVLRVESLWGSRYLELPDGGVVRVADHLSQNGVGDTMTRDDLQEIRVDLPDWQVRLDAVAATLPAQLTCQTGESA